LNPNSSFDLESRSGVSSFDFEIKLRFGVSFSWPSRQLVYELVRVLISTFDFQFLASISSFDFEYPFRVSISSLDFEVKLRFRVSFFSVAGPSGQFSPAIRTLRASLALMC